MTSAEASAETFNPQGPLTDQKIVFITATTTNATDYITVTGLTTIKGWYLRSADTVAAGSNATNIITLSNGATGNKTWYGFAWGQ